MTDTPTEDGFPRTIEETITYNKDAIRELTMRIGSKRKVLPFVGAGLSAAYRLKTWKAFLEHYAEEWGIKEDILQLLDRQEYEAAADALCNEMGDHAFQKAVDAAYGQHHLENFTLKGVFRFLPRLTNGPILTTNYDRIIEHTYKALGMDIERVVGAKITATQRACEQDQAILIKIHGDCEEVSDRILKGGEYDQHYGKVTDHDFFDRELPLPKALMKLMSGTSLLFLGCSLETDRTLNVLSHITHATNHGGHFALVAFPEKPDDLVKRKKHLSKHRITPIWYHPLEHHKLLTDLLEYLCKDIVDPAKQPDTSLSRLDIGNPWFGREKELGQLEQWYASGPPVCIVHGPAGIGKSRLCHRFLELWKKADPGRSLYYVDLAAADSSLALLDRMKEAMQLPEAIVNFVAQALQTNDTRHIKTRMGELANQIDRAGCIIYFDNLEDPLQDEARTRCLIEALAAMQHTRLLCSTRETLSSLGQNIPVHRLEDVPALELFAKHWQLSGATELIWEDAGRDFVHHQLDNHALSIKLVAAQAEKYYSLMPLLIEAWEQAALRLADSGDRSADKQRSLSVSLDLSFDALARREDGSIQFWALVAMFPEGMSKRAQKALADTGWKTLLPPDVLVKYNVLARDVEGRLRMLAPIRSYILVRLHDGAGGLNWKATLTSMYERFLQPIAKAASDAEIGGDPEQGRKYDELLYEFSNYQFWVTEACNKPEVWKEQLLEILASVSNFFPRRPVHSRAILKKMVSVFETSKMHRNAAWAIQKSGELEFLFGLPSVARSFYRRALNLFKMEPDDIGLAMTHTGLAKSERFLGNHVAALKHCKQAIKLSRQNGSALALANAYFELGLIERACGNPKMAIRQIAKAKRLYEDEHIDIGLANVLECLGDLNFQQGELIEARNLFIKAIELYIKERADYNLSETYRQLGDLERLLGNFPLAEEYLLKAMEFFDENRMDVGSAYLLNSFGDLFMVIGRLDDAFRFFQMAADQFRQLGHKPSQAHALLCLGSIYKQLRKFEEAKDFLLQSVRILEGIDAKLELANTLQSLGDLEIDKGNNQLALDYLLKAVDFYAEVSEPMGHALSLASISRIHNKEGQYSKRDSTFEQAIKKAQDSNNRRVVEYVRQIGKNWLG
jgi:tetratricopeptide (TPR) repeat protein